MSSVTLTLTPDQIGAVYRQLPVSVTPEPDSLGNPAVSLIYLNSDAAPPGTIIPLGLIDTSWYVIRIRGACQSLSFATWSGGAQAVSFRCWTAQTVRELMPSDVQARGSGGQLFPLIAGQYAIITATSGKGPAFIRAFNGKQVG